MKKKYILWKEKYDKIKFTILLLLVGINVGFANEVYSQSTLLSLNVNKGTVKDVFTAIERQSEYVFFYYDNALDVNRKVNIKAENKTVEEILKQVFAGTDNSYVIKDRQIFISKNDKKDTAVLGVAQEGKKKFRGKVMDDQGEPLPGATVLVVGSTRGVTTDLDGTFEIEVTSADKLNISFLGLGDRIITVGNQQNVVVRLEQKANELADVVVVGYGRQKKESVVGAISTVDVSALKVPGASLSSSLAGQLAGIVSMSRSGEPGKNSAAEFYIRGISSFKGTATPLVLVDGIERELDLVDTEDIASFSILKDAAASAVYGVRGANGVILITTKKGQEGKPRINARAEFGFTSPTRRPSTLGSAEWAELYNEASGSNYYSVEDIRKYRDGSDPDLYPSVDWTEALFDNMAENQRVNLSVTGGSDIVKYYVAGSYYHENSIYKSTGNIYGYNSALRYNKFNFRANVDINVTPSTLLNVNLANIYEKSFGPGYQDNDNNIWSYALTMSPNAFPVQYSDGTLSGPSTDSSENPWNLLAHSGYREQFWNSAQSLIGLTQDVGKLWEPLKGLTANIKFSWDAWNTTSQRRHKSATTYHAHGRAEDGSLIYDDNNGDGVWDPVHTGDEKLGFSTWQDGTMTTYLEGSLTYNRIFGEQHRVGGLLLYNQKVRTRTQVSDGNEALPYKNQGLAGRVTYAFRDTYFAEVNVGYNGSENFARGHRFGFFPAGAVGWMVSNEKWFEPITKVVDMLKLKASYGLVGNDDIGGQRRWVYESTIVDGGNWDYGENGNSGGQGLIVGEVENVSASWEEARKLNVGFELSLFEKVKLQVDYFHEKRTGIFMQRSGLPAIVGVSTIPYVNVGETLNRGIDANLEYSQKINKVFVTARGNFTYNRNKILNNDDPDWQYKYQNRIGKPFGSWGSMQPFTMKALGLFKSQEEIDSSPRQTFGEYRVGDLKYQDINGDGIINDSFDAVAVGYTNIPEITYGFGATAQWKGWDFNVFFQGVAHTSFFLSGNTLRSAFGSSSMERSAVNKDLYGKVWRVTNTPEENAGAIYPRLSLSNQPGSANNNIASDWWLRDGSFLRLKNLEVGYTLPQSVIGKSFIRSLRFYVSGNNLLTFSKFKLWDPEKGSSDGAGYPLNRVVTLGFNINL
ncbi:TonB-dependent receptor [Bacteroides oleiciplenus]|uniref:TonB-dependent receptor n=1 Tax=Bacteroides oleiciplenus TaxID=626931 RepID=UPI0026DB6E55|nr:TonB-dependent receptor [Bacteroides oleiciplenus]